MKNLLARIFQSNNPSITPKTLEEIRSFSDNIEMIPSSDQFPEHLVAHGMIVQTSHVEEIRTAIKLDIDEVEFSTNIGQIPNNPLGMAVTDNLNHSYFGKFVTF